MHKVTCCLYFPQVSQADQKPIQSANSTSVTSITRHHLDLQKLDQTVQRYFTAGLAPSSHKTYQAAECRYLGFCSSFALTPLPTSEELLCNFSACLGQQGLAHTTIRTYLSGVRQLQITYGGSDLNIDRVPRLH